MIGFLDKGGKWRKKNWYSKNGEENEEENKLLEMEREKAIKDD